MFEVYVNICSSTAAMEIVKQYMDYRLIKIIFFQLYKYEIKIADDPINSEVS